MASTTTKIILLLCIVLVICQIKYPYITTILDRIRYQKEAAPLIQRAKTDIGTIEEESLRRIHDAMGGVDDVNALTKYDAVERPKLREGFSPDKYELQLYYKIRCGYSQQFLPIWYELISALPRTPNVSYKEFNCDKLNCGELGITGVPTLKLRVQGSGVDSIYEYSGTRSYHAIESWLAEHGLYLSFNPDMEQFADAAMGTEVVNRVMTADGELRKAYAKELADATAMNEYDEYNDVQDGCYIASFSKCSPLTGTDVPGYQVFTHRGQWGCVYPEKGTGIATEFDAAFTAVDHYLSTCVPPQYNPETGEDIPISPAQRKAQMLKCAQKYKNEIRSFGLCNEDRLNEKYIAPDEIKAGRMKVPLPGMTAADYQGPADSAEAIYTACSI